MSRTKTNMRNKSLLAYIILAVMMLPLLGLHIHLPVTHSDDMHAHGIESHQFHIHTSSDHDNIDTDELMSHANDSKEINLDVETRISKLIQILLMVAVMAILLPVLLLQCCQLTHYHRISPCRQTFEYFRDLIRGPPLTH